MNWPDDKIGPCPECGRIRPLRALSGELACAECAHKLARVLEASDDPGAIATDGGEQQ